MREINSEISVRETQEWGLNFLLLIPFTGVKQGNLNFLLPLPPIPTPIPFSPTSCPFLYLSSGFLVFVPFFLFLAKYNEVFRNFSQFLLVSTALGISPAYTFRFLGFPGGGGVLKKVLYGEAPPQVLTPYPFIYLIVTYFRGTRSISPRSD